MSIRTLKLLSGAGDPDDILPKRIDVVNAAMKVLEAHEKGRKLNDFQSMALVDLAVTDLLLCAKRYKNACKKRKDGMTPAYSNGDVR